MTNESTVKLCYNRTAKSGIFITADCNYTSMFPRMLKDALLDTIPSRLQPLVQGAYWSAFPEEHPRNSDSKKLLEALPSTVPDMLPAECVAETDVVPSRIALLGTLQIGGTVAEIGVASGEFSKQILTVTNPELLYLIDEWRLERYGVEEYQRVRSRFAAERDTGRVELIRERSVAALERFDDGFFDWVYIDTSHSYEQTAKELEISKQKVTDSGMILGHDFCIGNPTKRIRYGVVPAVSEFCVTNGWRISYLTIETDGFWSFALEKLK